MLVITARIGNPIRIGDMYLVLMQVRGTVAKLGVQGDGVTGGRVRRKGGEPIEFVGSSTVSEDDQLLLGEISVLVSQIRGPQVRLGIDAPRNVRISTAGLDASRKAKEARACASSTS